MALYLIGDVQGCDSALSRLLDKIAYSPSRDRLIFLGDLVNRGPDSLAVLRRVMALGNGAQALLGNHDLHVLALLHGVQPVHRLDTVSDILGAPDRVALADWWRGRPLAHVEHRVLMVHAGVLPAWSVHQTCVLAGEVEAILQSNDWVDFLRQMYGNQPNQWQPDLQGVPRWRVIVNALTRLRFCSADGLMDFAAKSGADQAPPGLMPWFEVPGRATADAVVAFGHWSTLGWLDRPDVLSLDSGCVWGGALTAARVDTQGCCVERISVKCQPAQVIA